MMYASEDLAHEHKGILFGLEILEKMILMLEEDQPIRMKDVKGIVEFFTLFADKCHHGKEEVLLFPALQKTGIAEAGEPIRRMLSDHTEGRKYIARMREAFTEDGFDKDAFIQNASDYIALLRTHIEKENSVLFPLCDRGIPMEEQADLLKLFEEHEETVMGAGTHEKLHETLREYEHRYLPKE